jgi:hypothetical protein
MGRALAFTLPPVVAECAMPLRHPQQGGCVIARPAQNDFPLKAHVSPEK